MDIRFRLALAASLVVAVGAASYAVSIARPDDGLPVGDLLRVEQITEGDPAVVDHMRWSFEVFAGERRLTEEDLSLRFAPAFAAGFTAEALNEQMVGLTETYGAIGFVRFSDSAESLYRAVGVAEIGVPVQVRIRVAEDGRMSAWGLDELPSAPRLPGWQSAIYLAVGWLMLTAGLAAARLGETRQGWALLWTGLAATAAILILSTNGPAYTVGRVVPAGAIAVAVWLLADRQPSRFRRVAVGMAGLAAGLEFLAPLTRDPALIGHPDLIQQVTDSETVYRTLLSCSALAAGLALGIVALVAVHQSRSTGRWRYAPAMATAAVAGIWAVAEFGAAVEFAVGNGSWAAGPLTVGSLFGLAALPVLIGFRLVTSRWDRPEVAGLIIELESGGGDLQRAAARALEDPTVRVLTATTKDKLLDRSGRVVVGDDMPPGRTLTQILVGGQLVGGLDHDSALRHHEDRLTAVVAALGLALEVGRLNDAVTAQLDEVSASRARIIEAADAARRQVERDLHDGAQQRLVALGLDLQHAKRLAESEGHGVLAAELEAATREVRDTIDAIRSVSRGTQPAILTERGLAAAMESLAERSPVPVRVEVGDEPLPSEIEKDAYYVVSEALTNVAKHSGATRASVSIAVQNGAVHIDVSDDGTGGAQMAPGSGLEGLDDRVAATGGTFSVTTGPEGTTIKAEIPCE